jgi:hypothetical protein
MSAKGQDGNDVREFVEGVVWIITILAILFCGGLALDFTAKVIFGQMTLSEFTEYAKEHNLIISLRDWWQGLSYRLKS